MLINAGLRVFERDRRVYCGKEANARINTSKLEHEHGNKLRDNKNKIVYDFPCISRENECALNPRPNPTPTFLTLYLHYATNDSPSEVPYPPTFRATPSPKPPKYVPHTQFAAPA